MKLVYTQRARRDLARIHQHISKKSKDPGIADSFINRMIDACDELSFSGMSLRSYRFSPSQKMMPFEKYLIIFQIRNDEVQIVHFRHSARRVFRR